MTTYRSSLADTRFVSANGARYAYRDIGPAAGIPLLLINRFRGTMDDWDPELLDLLSNARRLIIFDNIGMARSSGTTPTGLNGFAEGSLRFAQALNLDIFDILGFSIGGLFAQKLALDHPNLVRRMILAASTPGYAAGISADPRSLQVATKPVNGSADFLYLFFTPSVKSTTAGREYLARLALREDAHEKLVEPQSWQGQRAAAGDVSTAQTSMLNVLHKLTMPVLVANGSHDIMVPTALSFEIFKALPDAKLILYPDSGHGFLFQYPRQFANDALAFLEEA